MMHRAAALCSTSFAFLALAVAPAFASGQGDSSFHIDVTRLGSTEGQVCVALFASHEGFPSDGTKATRSVCHLAIDAVNGVLRFTLDGLSMGEYAASVFQDENMDGKLNTGLFGIPKESFGFTGNPVIRIGAPKFGACAVSHKQATTVAVVALKSL